MVPAAAVIFLLGATVAMSQTPESGVRRLRIAGDSVDVFFALPATADDRPTILVLHDRFGMQTHIQSVLNVLATVGYRAFAIQLRSAPSREVAGQPDASLDSSDIARATEVAVDIMNEKGCTGRTGLFGFDVGAAVAAEMVARVPFFKACVMFYPSGGTATLARLPFSHTPMLLAVAGEDNECLLADASAIREVFIDQARVINITNYKGVKRFFFNPDHENYDVPAMKLAWKELIQFFNRKL